MTTRLLLIITAAVLAVLSPGTLRSRVFLFLIVLFMVIVKKY